jgi:hypothetical protein
LHNGSEPLLKDGIVLPITDSETLALIEKAERLRQETHRLFVETQRVIEKARKLAEANRRAIREYREARQGKS